MHEERVQAVGGTEEGKGGTEAKSKDGTEADPTEAAVGQDITCPRPSDEVMARVKAEIDGKRKERGAKKTKSAPASKRKSPTTKTTTRNMTTEKGKA